MSLKGQSQKINFHGEESIIESHSYPFCKDYIYNYRPELYSIYVLYVFFNIACFKKEATLLII